jgi:hypothetical protein
VEGSFFHFTKEHMFYIIVIRGDFMKTIASAIEVLTHTDKLGNMSPLKFKAKTKTNEDIVISVDKVESRELEKIAGNLMLLYKCRGLVNEKQREFELKFEIMSCKWMLWRM